MRNVNYEWISVYVCFTLLFPFYSHLLRFSIILCAMRWVFNFARFWTNFCKAYFPAQKYKLFPLHAYFFQFYHGTITLFTFRVLSVDVDVWTSAEIKIFRFSSFSTTLWVSAKQDFSKLTSYRTHDNYHFIIL